MASYLYRTVGSSRDRGLEPRPSEACGGCEVREEESREWDTNRESAQCDDCGALLCNCADEPFDEDVRSSRDIAARAARGEASWS